MYQPHHPCPRNNNILVISSPKIYSNHLFSLSTTSSIKFEAERFKKKKKERKKGLPGELPVGSDLVPVRGSSP
jgi:hypothetical protein